MYGEVEAGPAIVEVRGSKPEVEKRARSGQGGPSGGESTCRCETVTPQVDGPGAREELGEVCEREGESESVEFVLRRRAREGGGGGVVESRTVAPMLGERVWVEN